MRQTQKPVCRIAFPLHCNRRDIMLRQHTSNMEAKGCVCSDNVHLHESVNALKGNQGDAGTFPRGPLFAQECLHFWLESNHFHLGPSVYGPLIPCSEASTLSPSLLFSRFLLPSLSLFLSPSLTFSSLLPQLYTCISFPAAFCFAPICDLRAWRLGE